MKFRITRVSSFMGEEKPCDDAVQEEGSWVVHLNTLEDLMGLVKKEGNLILEQEEPWIKIFDDYLY